MLNLKQTAKRKGRASGAASRSKLLKERRPRAVPNRSTYLTSGLAVVLLLGILLLTSCDAPLSDPPRNKTTTAEIKALTAEIDALYAKRNNLLVEKALLETRLSTIRARIRELEEQL